ncbi:MAG: tRNA (guanosine(37)-N1)-methyltransferase TrmD [Deltaproteobacteria bacterium]|nr:tRNA (guanosine(37)-N1)-methyltransferase TrmD [Deltaproteobacteria bacterium]
MLQKIDVVTIFPELFETFTSTSILGAALAKEILEVRVHDLRSWAHDRHRKVDDEPYGGGPGMVMKPEPLVEAIEALAGPKGEGREARVALLSPQGKPFTQRCAEELAGTSHLVLVCGRYEGVDERVIELAVDEEISIGDYVLSGGEIPAMAVIEAVSRLLPGVLGNPDSVVTESFQTEQLEGPQFTRPAVFRGREVPEVLRSGDHAKIDHWRGQKALERTRERRPDLLKGDSRAVRGD